MRISRNLPQELRALRRELGLRQRTIEMRAGLHPRRLTAIERGVRPPAPEELEALCRVLNVPSACVRAGTDWQPRSKESPGDRLPARLRGLFGARTPFRWTSEVSFEGYLASVFREHRDTARTLERRIDQRDDLADIERGLRDLPCGARGEALLVMHLLARHWRITELAPLEIGFGDPRIRDFRDRPERPYVGCRKMRALAVLQQDLAAVVIPQVPFHAESSHVLDFLVAVRHGGLVVRGDLEIDGPGHDVSRDQARKANLGLPTLRFRDEDLDRPEVDLPAYLVEFCRVHGFKRRRALLRPLVP